MKSIGQALIRIILGLIFIASLSCVPQGSSINSPKTFPLIQAPLLSGDFGSINQLSQSDKVFSFVSENEEDSEIASLSLEQSGGAFSIMATSGCEKVLNKRERCLVKVRASGKNLSGSAASYSGVLHVGSVSVSLSVDYDPIVANDLEITNNNSLIDESIDTQCLQGVCYMILKYTNNALIPQFTAPVSVSGGFQIVSNTCGSKLNPNKSCYVKVRTDLASDLYQGEVVINANGSDQSLNVRVIKELDTVAPQVSINVLNSTVINGDFYLAIDNTIHSADLELSFDDNRSADKGLKYTLSLGGNCSSLNWIETHDSLNLSSFNLIPDQDNTISVQVKDALDNTSPCVSLPIKNLNALIYNVVLTQPPGGGLSVAGGTTVGYDKSKTISYLAPLGYEFQSWGGDCFGIGSGNTCVLNNIKENKNVSVAVFCSTNFAVENGLCVRMNTISCVGDAPNSTVAIRTWNGSSYGSCVATSCISGYTVLSGSCVVNAWPFNVSSDEGDLTVSGSTSISAGTHVYKSITVNPGATLTITSSNSSTPSFIGVKGSFINNGTIIANNSTFTGSVSGTAPNGVGISFSINQASGGSGGAGGLGASTSGRASPGIGTNGWGGGGSGGTFYLQLGGAGGSNNQNGGSTAGYTAVTGGVGGSTGGNGGDASGRSIPGSGGGSGGGAGYNNTNASTNIWSGGGGGGGAKGRHGQVVYFRTSNFSGSGTFNLSGSNGFKGGNGGGGQCVSSCLFGQTYGSGGGGGGGAGGSGGHLKIDVLNTSSFSGSVNVNPGSGGAPGAAGSGTGPAGDAGSAGSSGSNGSYSILNQ